MARRTNYDKMWSQKAKKGMKSIGTIGKLAAGGALLAGAAVADVAQENRKYVQKDNVKVSDKEVWGCLFMFVGAIALTVVFFVTELEFMGYLGLMALNVLLFTIINLALRAGENDKAEEQRKARYAQQQEEAKQQQVIAEKNKPAIETVEQMILNIYPLEAIEEELMRFTLTERKQITKESFLHALSHLVDDVEISLEYRDYLISFEKKFITQEVRISQFPIYKEYIKNVVLSSVLRGELPKKGTITMTGCPINFEVDEEILWVFNSVTSYQEVTKTINVGASQGLSVRIARGIYYRVGAFRGEPISTSSLKPLYYGDMIITNKNVYFYSTQKSVKYPYDKILAYVPFEDAIGIQQTRANAKTVYYKGIDGRYAFNLLTNIKNLS